MCALSDEEIVVTAKYNEAAEHSNMVDSIATLTNKMFVVLIVLIAVFIGAHQLSFL